MNFYSLLSFFSFTLSIYLGIYVLRLNSKSAINRLFFIIAILVGIWDFAYVFIYPESNKEILFFWYKITAIGWATFASFLLHFTFYLTKKDKITRNPYLVSLIYVPAIFFLIRALYGGFIATDFEIRNNIAYEIQNNKSTCYILFVIYMWSFLCLSIFHIKINAKKSKFKKVKIQANIMFYSVLVIIALSTITNLIFPVTNIRTIPPIAQIMISLFNC